MATFCILKLYFYWIEILFSFTDGLFSMTWMPTIKSLWEFISHESNYEEIPDRITKPVKNTWFWYFISNSHSLILVWEITFICNKNKSPRFREGKMTEPFVTFINIALVTPIVSYLYYNKKLKEFVNCLLYSSINITFNWNVAT